MLACNTTGSKIPFAKEEYRSKQESVLYLFRNRAFVGSGMEAAFFLDGKSVGVLPQNGYFPIHAVAGRHKLRGCSASLVAPEECEEIEVTMTAENFLILQVVMVLRGNGPRVTFVKTEDIQALTAVALGLDNAAKGAAPLKIVILNFTDQTGSNLYGWLSESPPDAIDQSMHQLVRKS